MTHARTAPTAAERFVALVGVLARECSLLEHLLFKLKEAELLTTAGETRFLMFMSDEIDGVAADLGAIEVARSVLVADLTEALGLDDAASLAELTDHASAQTKGPLKESRERLLALMQELDQATAEASDTVGDRLSEVSGALQRVEFGGDAASSYTALGANEPTPIGAARFDTEA